MKKASATALSLVVLASALLLPDPVAAGSGCVTEKEYRRAKYAWSMEGLARAPIRRWFGTDGTEISRGGGVMRRHYAGCGSGGNVTVTFKYQRYFENGPKNWWAIHWSRGGTSSGDLCSGQRPDAYPFSYLLSTSMANTGNQRVRAAVRSVQKALRGLGVSADGGQKVIVDGSYGPQTASAVRAFQRATGIIVDGKVGPQTWKRLGNRYC